MKIYLKGHDFSAAAQQIYMCMFENSHAEICEGEPEGESFVISRLEKKPQELLSTTEIANDGKKYVGSESVAIPENCSEEEARRLASRVIKKSFYKAAVELLPKPPAWGALTGVRPSKVAVKYIEKGMSPEMAIRSLCDEFFVSEERSCLAVTAARRANELSVGAREKDASLYVGIPFCTSRCKYCSFVSHSIEQARGLVAPYLRMLAYEIESMGSVARKSGLDLKTIYIGGGTPTSLSAQELAFVMESIEKNFDVSSALEYTVEAGRPDTLNIDKLRVIKEHGATRISINPQTMNNDILLAMDRRHTAEDVERAMSDVRSLGGLSVNMDLIAGLPDDTPESFSGSLERVIAMDPENITVHTLALKKGSRLRLDNVSLPTGEGTQQMVEYAMERVCDCGYVPYYLYRQKYMSGNLENVGYSKPGYEGLYNNYIMDELHTILSAGAGGVTKLIRREKNMIQRIFNPKYPYEYNNAKEKIDSGISAIEDFFANEGVVL